jgi:uncharacterized membrane protein
MSVTRRARGQLPAVLGGTLLTLLILLLPSFVPATTDTAPPVTAYHGVILEIIPADPDGADTGRPPVATARVEILEGERAGEVLDAYLEGPGGSQVVADYAPGDEVVVAITQSGATTEPYVAVADRWRVQTLQVLLGLFAIAVVVVGGWRGVRALVALGLTIAVILKIILPLILQGVPPLPMAVIGASAITAATILLTEGWSRASLAAILGTTGALSVTGLLAAAATAAAGFTYSAGSDLAFLQTQGGEGLDLRGILLAAIILGAVGVLDDVTVTQAVVVDELAGRGALRGRPLFSSALGIGRSHIGATVNTLFLAYVGASLPLLVVLLVAQAPPELVYNNEAIATEVVRTLAGSIGIVAAVPLTTAVAAMLVGPAVSDLGAVDGSGAGPGRPAWMPVLAIAGIVGLLLLATAVLPATQGGRTPLPTNVPQVEPGEPGVPLPSDGEVESPAPGTSEDPGIGGEPQLVERGEDVPVTVDGIDVGTTAVTRWAIAGDGGRREVTLEVRYTATADWALDPSAWEILTSDGGEVPFIANPALPPVLPAGDSATYTMRASMDAAVDLTDAFIAYLDTPTGSFVFLVALE